MTDPIPRITLEQWHILQAVVDHGGFAQAAEALHRSQSSVSYAIAKLQERLPVPVLIQSGRKAKLTEAGELLLRRARALLEQAHGLERLAASLAQGWEPEIRLAVEVIFPPTLLFEALGRFADASRADAHEVRVQLFESVLSGTDEALLSHRVDLAITTRVPPGFLGRALSTVEFLAVAAPSHPLHRLGRPLGEQDLKAHRQLVVRDSGQFRQQDSGWLAAEQRWTVSHLRTSIMAVRQGLGFAWIPREHIQEELARGELLPLPLAEGGSRRIPLYLVLADSDNAGPATRELARTLRAVCAERGG